MPPPISIPQDAESLYIFYKRDNVTLEVRDKNYNFLATYDVPVGAPLLAYIQNELRLNAGKTADGVQMQWATKGATSGYVGSYTLLTSDTTMPEDGITVYPVDPRQYAHVLLDIGAFDWNVYDKGADKGDFWGDYWGEAFQISVAL